MRCLTTFSSSIELGIYPITGLIVQEARGPLEKALANAAGDGGRRKARILCRVLYQTLSVSFTIVHSHTAQNQTCGAHAPPPLRQMQLFALITCIRVSTSLQGGALR